MNDPGIPWRDSARPVRLYFVDARALVALALWVLFPSWWMSALVLAVLVGARLSERRGYRPASAVRALRARLAGRRPALLPGCSRRLLDYG